LALLVVVAPAAAMANDAADAPRSSADHKFDYVQDVRPILMRRCSRCHGALKQEGGLRLDAGQLVRKGGDDGPVLIPFKPQKSKLLARITAADDSRMPPEGDRLSSREVDVLRGWIESGASFPNDERIPQDPAHHWAFQTPRQSSVPATTELSAVNPIDAFINARLTQSGCQATAMAPKHVLLRRVTLDLTGLPPSVDELSSFLADESPDAYPRVVDRLLANPAYGERWGRHWMDVWRYSDWYGFGKELRNSARHIWRWRDWIVESLNADRPYREMAMEMLAADEIEPLDTDNLRATGFLARNFYLYNRNVWLDSTVEHTAKAFLGITLNCARCHDHVYDPIEQADYYRFRAIFEPFQVRIDPVPGQADPNLDGLSRVFDADLQTPTFLFVRGNDKTPDKDHPLTAAVPAALHGPKWDVRPVSLPSAAYLPKPVTTQQPSKQKRAKRQTTAQSYPSTSSGRRLALARWIASEANPLTARVTVNHVWMRHFGKPLVPTVFDFGLNGKPPTHPELLDWLAVDFMKSGWNFKRLHRQIVLSQAYQRDSLVGAGHASSSAIDPDNQLLWRMNSRRLESEAVRDSVLAVTDGLDRRMGGAELDANLGETTCRRSIYYRHAPEKFMTFLQTFDAPNTNECYRRNETVVPQQALALSNSVLSTDRSRRLAGALSPERGHNRPTDAAYVDRLFEHLLCRLPSAAERSNCCDFLTRQSILLSDKANLTRFTVGQRATVKGSTDPQQRAREDLVHVLLNHIEFVSIR